MASFTRSPERLNVRGASNAAFASHAPSLLYSQDGKYLFQREGHVIRVVNTKNGQALHECVRAEQPALPNASETVAAASVGVRVDVTALALHPYNALQLIASYADGQLLVWDFIEEKILQQFDAKAPVLWMGASTASPLMLLLVIAGSSAVDKTNAMTKDTTPSKANKSSEVVEPTVDEDTTAAVTHWSVVEFNMKKKRRGRTLLEQTKAPFVAAAMKSYLSQTSDSSTIITSDDNADVFHGDYLVIIAAARLFTLKVVRDQDGGAGMGKAVAVQKLTHLRDVTCVTVNPSVPLEFAIGDALGQIFRYLNSASSTAKMHWHSHAVSCLSYSTDGQYLLSGGEENVLVSWHLESGRRAYLPRRSAPLTSIATRVDHAGSGYAISLLDNMLFQYNPITREEEWQSIGLARSGGHASHAVPWRELVFDPLTNALPLNGMCSAGALQFFEPYKDRVLFSLLLTERNQVTRTEDEELPQILAEKVAFSPTGMELVTLHRPSTTLEAPTGDEQALRFWKRRENGTFYVHTAIDAPHGSAAVTTIAYSPSTYASEGVVVTGDVQGEFKVWKKTTIVTAASTASAPGQQQTITNEVSTTVWHCQSVVKFRDTAISTIQFSRDGSLLAVAYGHLVTLWDLSTMALRGVLPSADGRAVQQVLFTGKTSPYVAFKTGDQIQVWNLLTMSLWWRYVVPQNGSYLTAAAKDDEFVVAIKVNQDYVALTFEPESPVPVQLQRFPFSESDKAIWTLAVHPKNGDVLLLDEVSNVWRVGEQRLDSKQLRLATSSDEDEMTPLAAMFKQARNEVQSKRETALARPPRVASSPDSTAALFDAPAHVLPSMTSLYRSFMDKMLAKPQTNAGAEDEEQQSKKSRKKNNKKRKKASLLGADEQPVESNVERAKESDESKQKRVKAMVEKELAGAATQKQSYSTMLAAFRKNKKNKSAKE